MSCIVPLCQRKAKRRKMCDYHAKYSTLLVMKCSHPRCTKRIFTLSLCREHYRKAYTQCAIDGCRKPIHCKNVCRSHYRKGRSVPSPTCMVQTCSKKAWMQGKCKRHFVSLKPLPCRAVGCGRPVRCSGYCTMHYFRARRQSSSKR